ncbi:MAG TPA: leucyl/phenylalanyl-tRNA--protein transferase [Sphingomonadaceae bacterium]|nr:leucyl/phenylalanyl-tRNA--protein transferase [Sphingomonadaceae bacterium]
MHAPAQKIIPPETLLLAYRSGIFPMADSRDDPEVFWVEPRLRAILPLDGFHCSRSLAKVIRQDRFIVTCNEAFDEVLAACAAPRPGRTESWISERIAASYRVLHLAGHAHSIECWLPDGEDGAGGGRELVGGLYGVGFERVFCGESMFSRTRDSSKVAMAWLVALLRRAGAQLLDCQFLTEHLASLGAVEIPQARYLELLADACKPGPIADLPAAYCALRAEAEGLAAGDGVAVGEALAEGGRAAAAARSSEGSGASSPGKLIAQSLTHTS